MQAVSAMYAELVVESFHFSPPFLEVPEVNQYHQSDKWEGYEAVYHGPVSHDEVGCLELGQCPGNDVSKKNTQRDQESIADHQHVPNRSRPTTGWPSGRSSLWASGRNHWAWHSTNPLPAPLGLLKVELGLAGWALTCFTVISNWNTTFQTKGKVVLACFLLPPFIQQPNPQDEDQDWNENGNIAQKLPELGFAGTEDHVDRDHAHATDQHQADDQGPQSLALHGLGIEFVMGIPRMGWIALFDHVADLWFQLTRFIFCKNHGRAV